MRRSALVVCIVLAQLTLAPTQAFAYCGGLSSYGGYWLSGGVQDFEDRYELTQVTGYIQGFFPDPVVNVSTAWNMLDRRGSRGLAQGGWVRRAGWSTYYVLAAFRSSGDAYYEFYNYVTPTYSHNYGVRMIPGSTKYEFSYNSSAWLTTAYDQGWTPNRIEIMGETQNHGDHFPGSAAPGPYVEFWGSTHTVMGLGYPNSLYSAESLSSTDVVGKTWLSGNDFYLWDKRCSDGG